MKWVNRIVTTILLTVLVLMLVTVVVTKVNGSFFGYELRVALSGSMEPTFQTGSVILVKETGGGNDFQKGDIVTFHSDDGPVVTHRIHDVEKDGDQYVTKGDNNDIVDDGSLPARNIIGKYTGFTIPYIGYVSNFARAQGGMVGVFYAVGALLLAFAGFMIWRAFHGRTKEEYDSSVRSHG